MCIAKFVITCFSQKEKNRHCPLGLAARSAIKVKPEKCTCSAGIAHCAAAQTRLRRTRLGAVCDPGRASLSLRWRWRRRQALATAMAPNAGVRPVHVAGQTPIQARNHYGSGPVWGVRYSVMDGDFVDCAKTQGSPDYHWREAVQTGPLPCAKTVLAPLCSGGAQNQWQSP